MFLEAVDQAIVPLETEIAQIGSVGIVFDAAFDVAVKVVHLPRVKIATINDFFAVRILAFSCTGMCSKFRWTMIVVVVSLAVFDEC